MKNNTTTQQQQQQLPLLRAMGGKRTAMICGKLLNPMGSDKLRPTNWSVFMTHTGLYLKSLVRSLTIS
jgi:hypothetical protein